MGEGSQRPEQGYPERIDGRRFFLSTAISLLIFVLCLFPPAGDWAWPRGWLFLGVLLASSTLVVLYLLRVNPDVIAGRVNPHGRPRTWDLLLGLLVALPSMLAIPIVSALDDGRYHWSRLSGWGCAFGYVLLLIGIAGMTWAEAVNRFFEPSVRIQTDRGHHVIDTGPYAIIRHPGYAFGFLLFLGMPLALGSLVGLIPVAVLAFFLVVRTMLEDRTLQAELPGYREYTRRVRYRLVPGLW
ncbi:methyltransferase family protein [Aquisphaera insulae]|uniref:methyltransferase family protein n=1 Tax=Aquisphaera insulae TaxID=2712864 RepID=UPI0013EA6293|nr:isoprenylcysteine carboxylmethyltransferase family protein [Aquisphaera insulae]